MVIINPKQIQDIGGGGGVRIPTINTKGRWGADLLFGQIFLKTAWKWRKLNQEVEESVQNFTVLDPQL